MIGTEYPVTVLAQSKEKPPKWATMTMGLSLITTVILSLKSKEKNRKFLIGLGERLLIQKKT